MAAHEEDLAEVIVTGRLFHHGHIAEAGTTIAGITPAEADMLVAAGAAERYDG